MKVPKIPLTKEKPMLSGLIPFRILVVFIPTLIMPSVLEGIWIPFLPSMLDSFPKAFSKPSSFRLLELR